MEVEAVLTSWKTAVACYGYSTDEGMIIWVSAIGRVHFWTYKFEVLDIHLEMAQQLVCEFEVQGRDKTCINHFHILVFLTKYVETKYQG